MKFTFSWLKDHLDTAESAETIADKLTMLGLEMEGLLDRAAGLRDFLVARVTDARPHPDADKLTICTVDTGTGSFDVVCGAPNARAGMTGVFAAAGCHIPGTDITLKKAMIRGVESNGMLLSEREMGLSDDHAGIVDIDVRHQGAVDLRSFDHLYQLIVNVALYHGLGRQLQMTCSVDIALDIAVDDHVRDADFTLDHAAIDNLQPCIAVTVGTDIAADLAFDNQVTAKMQVTRYFSLAGNQSGVVASGASHSCSLLFLSQHNSVKTSCMQRHWRLALLDQPAVTLFNVETLAPACFKRQLNTLRHKALGQM